MDEFQYITMINKIDHLKTIKSKVELYRELYNKMDETDFTSIKKSTDSIYLFKCLEKIETTLEKIDKKMPKGMLQRIENLKQYTVNALIKEKASFKEFKDIFEYTTHIELKYIDKHKMIALDKIIRNNNLGQINITYHMISDRHYNSAFNGILTDNNVLAKIATLESANAAVTNYRSTVFNDCLNKLYKTLPEDTTNIADVIKQLQREYNTSVNAMLEKL